MRISSDEREGDAYALWSKFQAAGTLSKIKVYLDGVEQKYCDLADDEVGVVRRCLHDADGDIYAIGEDVAVEAVHGVVRIELPASAA